MTIEIESEEEFDRDFLDCFEEDSLIAVEGAIRDITYKHIYPISCKMEEERKSKKKGYHKLM